MAIERRDLPPISLSTNGIIAQMGRISDSEAKRVIYAKDQIVAPGFIDLHTHFDSQLFWDPYCTMSGWHGVTSVVIGNCGFGFAPVEPEHRQHAMQTLERNEAIRATTMAAGMPGLGDLSRISRQRRPEHPKGSMYSLTWVSHLLWHGLWDWKRLSSGSN